MSIDPLKRPTLFNVQKTKTPTLALVNQHEHKRLEQRQQFVENDDEEEERSQHDDCVNVLLPVGALPLIRSPRREKVEYVAKATRTPDYFRWTPKFTTETAQKATPPKRKSPYPPTPRTKVMSKKCESGSLHSLFSASHQCALDQLGPNLFELDRNNSDFDGTNSIANMSTSLLIQSVRMTPLAHPHIEGTKNESVSTQQSPVLIEPVTNPVVADLFEYDVKVEKNTNSDKPQTAESVPPPPVTDPASSGGLFSDEAEPSTNPDLEILTNIETVDKRDDSGLVKPLEFSSEFGIHRPPPEKLIAQHVLSGKFMRTYLHFSNLAKKIKETEEEIGNAELDGASTRPSSKEIGLFSRSFMGKNGPVHTLKLDELAEASSPQVPILRRLSSIDKAINKTVKKIRRISGMDDSQLTSESSSTQKEREKIQKQRLKIQGLKAINERMQHSDNVEFSGIPDGDDDGDPYRSMDSSSARMLRICQHVIAKRAVKGFLREEMSLITKIEIALRDDVGLQSNSVLVGASSTTTDARQANDRRDLYRTPLKTMNATILEAVTVYLREDDQHNTLEELYLAALAAERDKLWKRSILLASACIVIDKEFILAVLLRARSCRRIGLWAQAIKDLSHAILLRPNESKLVLLRAGLYAKMSELDLALVDTNRALVFHPKSIDTLLLRADIYHRQHEIGSSLQDLTTALHYDPSCWRAYYDRATIRIRAIEGDEQSLSYHWENMKYEKLLASIIEDYVNALRKGCQMVEVVETVGDLTIRLLEYTGDINVLRQVANNFTHLLNILAHDHRRTFVVHGENNSNPNDNKPKGSDASDPSTTNRQHDMTRELLLAAIHSQRGRLHVLLNDMESALADFDHAVVTEYHYPVAHFYRGAYATVLAKDGDEEVTKANIVHLTRCISLDPTIAGAYTVRGALYLRDLKFNNALQDFRSAVATDPTLYEVWLQIALIYLNHYHDCNECIKACSNALTNDSCLARALYLRAEAYTRQGNIKAALRDYGRLSMAQPDDRWAQLMRGRLLLKMKHARPALYAFIQFMQLGAYAHVRNGTVGSEADKRAHLLCGRAYHILARYQRAVEEFQRAVALNPTSENLVLLSESLHSMGDTENSLRVSEKVINTDPNSFRGYARRAQLYMSVGQLHNALTEYDKALYLAPKESRVYYERGIVKMQLYLRWRVAHQVNFEDKKPNGNTSPMSPLSSKKDKPRVRSPFEPNIPILEVEAMFGLDAINDQTLILQQMKHYYTGAIDDFTKCIRFEPQNSDAHVDRAELYVLGQNYEKAFYDFQLAIEYNPRSVRAYVNFGVLKCQFSSYAAAIADFDQAIGLDSRSSVAYFNRGVSYHKLSLWHHAERSYCLSIEYAGIGQDIDAYRNRAITRCHLRSYEEALNDFEEVRQSAPDDDQLHGGLGYVLLQLGRYEDAARCFATYGRLNRDTFADSGNAYFNLGCGSQQTSDTNMSTGMPVDQKKYIAYLKTALRFYLRGTRLHPSNLDLRLNIANCLRKMNEPKKAITQCDAIHAARPLHHACLESKALAYYQLHKLEEAIDWMNAAIRTCISSSSVLANIFYAFAHQSIHRNALEQKTVQGVEQFSISENTETSDSNISQESNHLRDGKTNTGMVTASEIVLTGSSKQMLSIYLLNRGILHEKLGHWDDAHRDYSDALHFDPLSINAMVSKATLFLMQTKYDASKTMFEKALQLEPKNGLVHINLGVVLMCLNDYDAAIKHFDIAILEIPTCSYSHANRAVALATKGDLKGAEIEFKLAIEQLPTQKEFYLSRGKIIAQQKRLQDAMVDFSTAVYLNHEDTNGVGVRCAWKCNSRYLFNSVASRARVLREDWDARELIDCIQIQLLQVVEYINRFHASTSSRMAILNAKMDGLERTLRYVEATVRVSTVSTNPIPSSPMRTIHNHKM